MSLKYLRYTKDLRVQRIGKAGMHAQELSVNREKVIYWQDMKLDPESVYAVYRNLRNSLKKKVKKHIAVCKKMNFVYNLDF